MGSGTINNSKFEGSFSKTFTSTFFSESAGSLGFTESSLGAGVVGGISSELAGGDFGVGFAHSFATDAFNRKLHRRDEDNQLVLNSEDSLSGFEIDQVGAVKIYEKLGFENIPDSSKINVEGIILADDILNKAIPADALIRSFEPSAFPIKKLTPSGVLKKFFFNIGKGAALRTWHDAIDSLAFGLAVRSGIKNGPFSARFRGLPR